MQNNWAYFLLIAEFAYNISKSLSTNHMLFDFNCEYYFCIFYKEDLEPYS